MILIQLDNTVIFEDCGGKCMFKKFCLSIFCTVCVLLVVSGCSSNNNDSKQRYRDYIEKDMITIKAGVFKMGSEDDSDGKDAKPVHEVKLDEFKIGRYEVTNKLYEKFDPNHKRDKKSSEDNQPVVNVNWNEAVMFCKWLGCRLPTEAEWEYACRAGSITAFNTGENLTPQQANCHEIGKTTVVGTYPPNAWGLYDMHGNVSEWCSDWFDEEYYKKCLDKGIVVNPQGAEIEAVRIIRGGGFYIGAQLCRSALRRSLVPSTRIFEVGIRLVFVP